MATDRMAAYRAQRQAGQSATGTAADGPSHELTTLQTNGAGNGGSLDSMPAFLAEASDVQDAVGAFSASITRVAALHNRSLDALAEDAPAIKLELDGLITETMAQSAALKDRVTRLQGAVSPGARGRQEKEMRQNRVTHVRAKFMEALQTYQQVEQEYRAKSRQRVERQYRIVKPDATQEEISEVVSGGGDQVFMQALTTSPRYAQSRSAYNEVQARAQELKRMEQTLGELAQLFSDMAVLVEQQDETVVAIENTAIDVEKNAGEALKETSRAVEFARSARGKRWICFFIVLIVVAILAIVLAIEFTKNKN
ncbi:t-SNARE [Mycena belliarum]|uniref:t-SNARE n=1 Tax=Mycena belliarum TaxID=1033014 RepID=A0AAD6UE46_9AGAR|nr:t-SNARE [Mycena belliae]